MQSQWLRRAELVRLNDDELLYTTTITTRNLARHDMLSRYTGNVTSGTLGLDGLYSEEARFRLRSCPRNFLASLHGRCISELITERRQYD